AWLGSSQACRDVGAEHLTAVGEDVDVGAIPLIAPGDRERQGGGGGGGERAGYSDLGIQELVVAARPREGVLLPGHEAVRIGKGRGMPERLVGPARRGAGGEGG